MIIIQIRFSPQSLLKYAKCLLLEYVNKFQEDLSGNPVFSSVRVETVADPCHTLASKDRVTVNPTPFCMAWTSFRMDMCIEY